MSTPETLTATQIASYRDNGYLVLERRVPIETIEAIRSEIARFEAEQKAQS